jgi:hypothetical protein
MPDLIKTNILSASALVGKASTLVVSSGGTPILVAPPPGTPASTASIVSAGLPRDQVTVPISSSNPPDDTKLFEQPADGNQKLYLPRYRVGQQTVSGAQQYRMLFKQVGTAWTLTIHLEKFPAHEIEEKVGQGVPELAHNVTKVYLSFQLPVAPSGQTLQGQSSQLTIPITFQEIVQEPGGVVATLTMNNLSEMNQIFGALTNSQSGTQLIIERAIRVGVMTTRPWDDAELQDLNIRRTNLQTDITNLMNQVGQLCGQPGIASIQAALALLIQQIGQYQTAITNTNNNIPNLQANVNEAEQNLEEYLASSEIGTFPGKPGRHANPVIVKRLSDAVSAARATLAAAVASIQRNQQAVQSNNQKISQITNVIAPAIAGDETQIEQIMQRLNEIDHPQFDIADFSSVTTAEPQMFNFPKETNKYIYSAVTGDGDSFGLVAYQVQWQNVFHRYFQNRAQPNIFYYLPDSFKQARTLKPAQPGDPAHKPDMSVQFNITGSSTEGVQAVLNYHAVPWVDHNRLASAASELSVHIGEGMSSVRFEPLAVGSDKVRFRLAVPPSGDLQDMTANVQLDFDNGITGVLTMGLNDFPNTLSAMLGGSLTLLTGQVHIDLGGGESDDVPLTIRMDDLVGELFDYQFLSDPATGRTRVTLCNAIESPLQVNQLNAALVRGSSQVNTTPQEFEPPLPCTLQPGQSLTCIVPPATSLPGEGSLSVLFDVSGVKVMPDREMLYQAILDPHTSAEYLQEITVTTFAQTYSPLPEHPEPVSALFVQFEDGSSIVMNDGTSKPGNTVQTGPDPQHLNAAIYVHLPISDFVLKKPTQGEYRYKITVIRGMEQVTDAQWRSDSRTFLPLSSIAEVPNH